MKLHEIAGYENKKAIAVYPINNHGGLEILDIVYDIDVFVIACFNFGNKRDFYGKHKIYTNTEGRSYFRKLDHRYYLDEIMRV